MLRRSSQNYVCWRCLCLRPPAERALLRRCTPRAAAAYSALATSRTPLHGSRIAIRLDRGQLRPASTEQSSTSGGASHLNLDILDASESSEAQVQAQKQHRPSKLPIRERLRKWEAENPSPALAVPRDQPADASVANILTKNRSELTFTLDNSAQDDDTARLHFDGVDMADLGPGGAILQAGDLVEVGGSSWKLRLLSICLGNFNGHLHFYTITGKWFTSRFVRSGFVVKKFIQDPAELQAVIDAIPSLSPDSTVLDQLQDLNIGPSRDLAASLIRKMFTFQSAARHIHQTYVERLSRAHTALGNEERLLSLREIADALLPATLKRDKGVFPPEVLYAVYCVVEEQDLAFRALDRGPRHRESYIFMLRSGDIDRNVRQVEKLLRDYYNFAGKPPMEFSQSAFVKFNEFLGQARELIDLSREERGWSPYGMVGPYRGVGRSESSGLRIPSWSGTGRALLQFMQHWASGGFPPGSRWHWIGPSILRVIGRYQDALLDSTTGWTFLQEVGWIPPWDVSARHALRLPGIPLDRHVGFLPSPNPGSPAPTASALGPDRLAHLRQDFARSTVYCIDSADTLDVDDGISLEPAGNGEHWIHVHIADPASRIAPGSRLAQQAALRVQTNYLAGFYRRMLDGDDIREAFSLGPNKPTLTFSARVTETGRLLESKVTPGLLRDVVYITPEEVASVCDDTVLTSIPPDVLEVGTRPAKDKPPVKKLTTASNLSRGQRKELQTLWKLADALQQARIENGAIPGYLPRAKATVSLDGVTPVPTSEDSAFYRGDPYIRVAYDWQGIVLVSSLMQLAGEVGARWCYERDIPVPFRVQVIAAENLDALRKFNREVFYPQLAAGKKPSPQDWHTLLSLVGGFDISTTPAPNLAMGLELYTKVTSPLRRYPDMLVHWQIEAALLEEERRGQSLVVRKSPGSGSGGKETGPPANGTAAKELRSCLPFSKKHLEENIFPRLRVREKHGRLLDNIDGNSQWILQALVRAWCFGEGSSPLPKTFQFRVSDVVPRRALKGQIDWFDRPASVELEDMNNVVRIADVKPGDAFKVELADVNVYMNRIRVRLLEKIET